MADYETAAQTEMMTVGYVRNLQEMATLAEAYFRSHPGETRVSGATLRGIIEPQPVRKVYSNRNREAHRVLQRLEGEIRRADLAMLEGAIARDERLAAQPRLTPSCARRLLAAVGGRDEAEARCQWHSACRRARIAEASGGGRR